MNGRYARAHRDRLVSRLGEAALAAGCQDPARVMVALDVLAGIEASADERLQRWADRGADPDPDCGHCGGLGVDPMGERDGCSMCGPPFLPPSGAAPVNPERAKLAEGLLDLVERVLKVDEHGLMIWRQHAGRAWAINADWIGERVGASLAEAVKAALAELGE